MDGSISAIVAAALAEDVGAGDLTSDAVVPAEATARAWIVQKQPGVVFGLEVAAAAFAQTGAGELERIATEGVWHDDVPAQVAEVAGSARGILAAERTALNLLARLSGIATLTARYVRAIDGTSAKILDTRKTTPGLRALEKAAVAAGGGRNHRMGLYDAILIKENHVAIAGGLAEAVRRAHEARAREPVEVECRDLDEVEAALGAGADRILLDNMAPPQLREAVAARDRERPRVQLEASGGITLENARATAEAGVDFISVGALTHSAPALDLSLLLETSCSRPSSIRATS